MSDPIEVCAPEDVVGWLAILCWRMVSISTGADDGGFECTGEICCAGTSNMFEDSRKVSLAGAAEVGCCISILARCSTLAAS